MTDQRILTLAQEMRSLQELAADMQNASTALVFRFQALEQRVSNLEAANMARAIGEPGPARPIPVQRGAV